MQKLWQLPQEGTLDDANSMKRFQLLEELAGAITKVECDHPIRIAIDGPDASGKTTLADELVGPLESRVDSIIRSSVDTFHQPKSFRYQRGRFSAEGYFHDSFDYPTLIKQLLAPLGDKGTRQYRIASFDYRVDQPVDAPTYTASNTAILIFDGVFLLRPELREYWDISIYLDVSPSASIKRARARDADKPPETSEDEESTRSQVLDDLYHSRYLPAQTLYFESCRPVEHADIVVNYDDLINPTILWRGHDIR